MNDLQGKVALITGASKGIGAEIAKSMAKQGANVIVNYFSDEEGGNRVVKEIKELGGNAVAIKADVREQSDILELFKSSEKSFGKIDILVNNAGVYSFEPIEIVTENEFHRQFNSNVLSIILTIQEALKHFNEQGGTIINISSVASVMASPMSTIYSASKGAVDAITRTLSKELGPKNIRINSILPGPTETEGNPIIGSEMEGFVVTNTPLGRIGDVKDIAKLASFLASDDAKWITGQKVVISGGFD